MSRKKPKPVDPRFKGATPEKLARALRRPKPKKENPQQNQRDSTDSVKH